MELQLSDLKDFDGRRAEGHTVEVAYSLRFAHLVS